MKTISAFRADDGSLHETREGAAGADLAAMGFPAEAVALMIERRADIEAIFRQISGLEHIPVYYPELLTSPPPLPEAA